MPDSPQYLVVLAGVVGSGKSTLSSAWANTLPGWVRVNQDDLGDRRTCEQVLRSHLSQGRNVVLDRQNFDRAQRRTWLEIASEYPHLSVVGMVMGTSKDDCRSRLVVRQNHPTIDNAQLALSLLDKFSGLWEEPQVDEGFDHLITLPSLPPGPAIDAPLVSTLIALALATPLNPLASEQRRKRPPPPRAHYGVGTPSGTYRRPDGFVDDGTWRPLRSSAVGPPPVAPRHSHWDHSRTGAGAGPGYRPPPASQSWGPPPPPPLPSSVPPTGYQGIPVASGHSNQWSRGPPHVWGNGNRLGGPPEADPRPPPPASS